MTIDSHAYKLLFLTGKMQKRQLEIAKEYLWRIYKGEENPKDTALEAINAMSAVMDTDEDRAFWFDEMRQKDPAP